MRYLKILPVLLLLVMLNEAGPALAQGTCPASMDIITVTSSASSGAGSFSEALNNVATTNGCIDVLVSDISIGNAYVNRSFRLHGNGAVLSGSGILTLGLYHGTDDFYLQDLTSNVLTLFHFGDVVNGYINRFTLKTRFIADGGKGGGYLEINNSTIGSVGGTHSNRVFNNSTIYSSFQGQSVDLWGGSTKFKNTIIAYPCRINGGSISSLGGVLSPHANCKPDISSDPLLGPLGENGGLTLTAAIGQDSPAFNAGSGCLPEDQRGITRPQMGACDIGAFEVKACATELECLQTVVAQQATVIAVIKTPNSESGSESIDYTLSSGDTFTIRREASYGSIFTGAINSFIVLLMLLAFPTIMVFWRR